MPNRKNIEKHKWEKGVSGNPNGRPRKFVTTLREQGYKLSEINDTIQALMSMRQDELKAVFDDPESTILEKTIANAMHRSLTQGSLYSIETLLTRVFGRPKEQIEVESSVTYTGLQIEIVKRETKDSR